MKQIILGAALAALGLLGFTGAVRAEPTRDVQHNLTARVDCTGVYVSANLFSRANGNLVSTTTTRDGGQPHATAPVLFNGISSGDVKVADVLQDGAQHVYTVSGTWSTNGHSGQQSFTLAPITCGQAPPPPPPPPPAPAPQCVSRYVMVLNVVRQAPPLSKLVVRVTDRQGKVHTFRGVRKANGRFLVVVDMRGTVWPGNGHPDANEVQIRLSGKRADGSGRWIKGIRKRNPCTWPERSRINFDERATPPRRPPLAHTPT